MWKWIRRFLIVVLTAVFCFSAVKLFLIWRSYKKSEAVHNEAVEQFIKPSAFSAEQTEGAAEDPGQAPEGAELPDGPETGKKKKTPEELVYAPFEVDFDELTAVNKDVIGWIYCEDTVINYPVVWGRDNSHYLNRNYRGRSDPSGTIFSDMGNTPGFGDYNVILYGHHMYNMTMFGPLEYWLEQDFYDEHPVMWLLTPEQDYKVELLAGYVTSADSDAYTVFSSNGPAFETYLKNAVEQSVFTSPVEIDPEAHYVMLSTCSYFFSYSRTVLHCKLVPVDTAGGVLIQDVEELEEFS